MDPAIVLSGLKYIGFVVAAASSTWALIAKTTYEDEQKRKRLTPAGYISLPIIAFSAVVSAVSFGFETVVKLNSDKAASDQKRADKAATEAVEARKQARADRNELLRRADAAEARATAAEQKSLQIALAGQERERQAALEAAVNTGSQDNLKRTNAALSEIGRVLRPIDSIRLSVQWRLEAPTYLPPAWRARAARQLANMFSDQSSDDVDRQFCPNDMSASTDATGSRYLELSKSSCFPRESYIMDDLTHDMEIDVAAYSPASQSAMRKILRSKDAYDIGRSVGDAHFSDGEQVNGIRYYPDRDVLTLYAKVASTPSSLRKNGLVVSIPDLEKSTVVIHVDGIAVSPPDDSDIVEHMRERLIPLNVVLETGGRRYHFGRKDIETVHNGADSFFLLRNFAVHLDRDN